MRRLQFDPKRFLPVLLGSVAGILILANALYPQLDGLQRISAELLRWVIVLGAFAVVVGILNVVAQHVNRVRRRDPRAPYSVALLIGLLIPPGVAIAQYATGRFSDNIGPLFEDIVRWVYTPLSASLLALLTFFGITAAVHALRGGNREAIVIVIVAALVLIIQLPLLSGVPIAGEISRWLHDYIALAGARGLVFGSAIGAIVASLRILLGLDRPYLDR